MGSCLSSCHHESVPPLLTGEWLWETTAGGIAGVINKPKSSERIILSFSVDGKFSVRRNDTLAYNGTFQLTKVRSIYSGKEELKIETNEIKTGYHRIIRPILVVEGVMTRLSETQLEVGDNKYDGFGSSFVRN